MEYSGFVQVAISQFILRLEAQRAVNKARQQMQARIAAVRYAKAVQVDFLVRNNDPAVLWD